MEFAWNLWCIHDCVLRVNVWVMNIPNFKWYTFLLDLWSWLIVPTTYISFSFNVIWNGGSQFRRTMLYIFGWLEMKTISPISRLTLFSSLFWFYSNSIQSVSMDFLAKDKKRSICDVYDGECSVGIFYSSIHIAHSLCIVAIT